MISQNLRTSHRSDSDLLLIAAVLAALAAVAFPAWLAYNVPPSSTLLNQLAALAGWGMFCALLMVWLVLRNGAVGRIDRPTGLPPLLCALGLLAAAALWSAWGPSGSLPPGMALSSVGALAAAAVVASVGALMQRAGLGRQAFGAFCIALVAIGLVSMLIGLVQYFWPEHTDGFWMARNPTPGRVGANLRQANHLSSLLLWSMVALLWLHESGFGAARVAAASVAERVAAAVLWLVLVFGVVLTVSRTGAVCLALLAVWGLVDRRLSPFARVLLVLAPVVFVLGWWGLSEWAQAHQHAFSGADQLHKSDLSSSRYGIWRNALALVAQKPWSGVGWGGFNFAWSLTPFPGRPVAFFDHTHNLPVQLLVEVGVPLACLVMGLLLWALGRMGLACVKAPPGEALTLRCAFVMVAMMVIHSLFEYPLWYLYFLLPTAFAFGIGLGSAGRGGALPGQPGHGASRSAPRGSWLPLGLFGASVVMTFAACAVLVDYVRVVEIFSSKADSPPLSVRIKRGQGSWFFAHHADYAAVTVSERPSEVAHGFDRASHFLLDTRLMMAWAEAYEEQGDVERARHLAARLREFRNPQSEEFFAECEPRDGKPLPSPLPFQCTPPNRVFTYEDFKPVR